MLFRFIFRVLEITLSFWLPVLSGSSKVVLGDQIGLVPVRLQAKKRQVRLPTLKFVLWRSFMDHINLYNYSKIMLNSVLSFACASPCNILIVPFKVAQLS